MIRPKLLPFEKIIAALNSYGGEGSLEFLTYPNKTNNYILPNCCHLNYKLTENIIETWGVGKSEDESFGKALMELLERIYSFSSNSNIYETPDKKKTEEKDLRASFPQVPHLVPNNSNGMAIHINFEDAYTNARKELIERHVVLKALACKIPPLKINTEITQIISNLKLPSDFEFRFYAYKGPLSLHVVVCETRLPSPKGSYFCFGTECDLKKAMERSFLESVPSVIYSASEDKLVKHIQEIDPNNIKSFSDFHRYSGNTFWSDFFHSTHSKNILPEIDKDISEKTFLHASIPAPDFLNTLDKYLVCLRVINPYLQQLFYDNWKHEHINPLAIDEKTILPTTPHFIP